MAIKKIKAIVTALAVSTFLASCFSTGASSKTNKALLSPTTDDGYNPANFVMGDYQIISSYYNYPILISGDYDQGNNKPSLELLKTPRNDNVIDTKTMLSICPIKDLFLENAYCTYYISSPADYASRIDCVDGNFNAGNLWFFKEKDIDGERTRENIAQHIYIESKEVNKQTTYRFFFYNNNTKYYIAVNYNSTNLQLILVNESLRKTTYDKYTKFYLKTLSGDCALASTLGLGNESSISLDNITEVNRTLNYVQKNRGAPKFSKPFSFSLAGETLTSGGSSGSTRGFGIAYNDTSLRINASLVYQSWWTDFYTDNVDSYTWKTGMSMEATDRSSSIRGWKLDVLNNYPNQGTNTNGVFVIETYNELTNQWTLVSYAPFANPTNKQYVSSFALDWENQLSNEPTKFRIGFVFKMYGEIKSDTKIVVLRSEEFALYYYGGSSTNFLPVQVASVFDMGNTVSEETTYNAETVKFRDEDYAILEPNACVNANGFFVKPLLKGYYADVYYAKNYFDKENPSSQATEYYKVSYGAMKTFAGAGRYLIYTKDVSGNTTNSGYIYVTPGRMGEFLFPNKFSRSLSSETAVVTGDRITSGRLPYELSSLGLTSKYPDYGYPVYYRQVVVKDYLRRLSLIPSFNVSISRYKDESRAERYETIAYNLDQMQEGIILKNTGFYNVVVKGYFNTNCGLNYTFTFKFYLVDEPEDNTINFSLKNVSQEVYDLKPFAYSVFKDYVTVAYINQNSDYVPVQVPVYYAFATYDDALIYALSKCKRYVTQIEPGVYRYVYQGEEVITDEVGAFEFIYNLAKTLVEIKTMTIKDLDTLSGFVINEGDYANIYGSLESIPSYYLITTDKDQLAQLTNRQFINHFQFFTDTDGVVSNHVELYDENNNLIDDNVPYFTDIEEYMISKNLPNGNYVFVDVAPTTKSYIYATYVRSKSDTYNHCDAVSYLSIDGQKKTLTMDNNEQIFTAINGFTLNNIVNPYDNYSLITVTNPDGSLDLFASHDDINKTYDAKGTYLVHVEDRLGNYYEFSVKVGANNE